MRRMSKRWGEHPQFTQGVFAAAFILGVSGILVLKLYHAPQFWVTAWPVALMALYASLVFIPPIRLRPDQTGDNIYYLGFLFTLVSLGYSLHEFTTSAGVDQIVQNFGIAIASTIAGVFGRVVLNQMRADPWEVERSVRLALVDSARNLRNELDNSVIEFNAYRRQIQQAAADGIRELQTIASDQLSGSTERLERMVQDTTNRVEGVVGRWTETANGFNQKSEEMAGAMEQLSGRLETVRAPAEIINDKMEPASRAVERLAAAADGAASNLQAAINRMEMGAADLQSIVESSRDIVQVAKSQADVLSEAGEVLAAARQQVEQMGAASTRFEEGIAKTSGELASGLLEFLKRLEGQLALAKQLAEDGHRIAAEGPAQQIAQMAEQINQLVLAQGEAAAPAPANDGDVDIGLETELGRHQDRP